jgi:hypothetical protein
MKDFFTRYRESHKNPVIVPAIFLTRPLFCRRSKYARNTDRSQSISANVVSGLDKSVTYPADLIMERDGNTLKFIIWKDAENVESLHFSLLEIHSHLAKSKAVTQKRIYRWMNLV